MIGDLPFGSYEISDEQAVASAVRMVKEAGCDAVKLEGGGPASASRARAIIGAGIPVMGHVGLTPQSSTALGGWKAQGRTAAAAARIASEALALQGSGCFAIVFEAIPSAVTKELMPHLEVPVIGIGAGPDTDGQVLVFHDLLGIRDGLGPRFVKRYANIQQEMNAGVSAYAEDVRSGATRDPSTATRSTRASWRSCTRCWHLVHRSPMREHTVQVTSGDVVLAVLDLAQHARGRAGHDRERLDVFGDDAVGADHAALADLTPLVTTTLAPSQQLSPIVVGPLLSKPCQVIGLLGIVVAVAGSP